MERSQKGGYDFGEVDWEEFYAVVRGEGPVAKERMAARRAAWDDGAWVREAAAAHEEKRRERKASGGASGDWPLWEVFVRAKAGLAHRHVGSVHAPDAELALRHARDTYTRRGEGVSLWVVPSAESSHPTLMRRGRCSSRRRTRSTATRPSTTSRTK